MFMRYLLLLLFAVVLIFSCSQGDGGVYTPVSADGTAINGELSSAGEIDMYGWQGVSGNTYRVTVTAVAPAPFDIVLESYGKYGFINEIDGSGSDYETYETTAGVDQLFKVGVKGASGSVGTYTVTVETL